MTKEGEILYGALKASAWERAKGALRELVAIKGANITPHGEEPPFIAAQTRVETFIMAFEGDGLHE